MGIYTLCDAEAERPAAILALMPERVEAPLGANINTWTKAARDAKQKHKAAVHGHGMYRLLACGVWAIREERDS